MDEKLTWANGTANEQLQSPHNSYTQCLTGRDKSGLTYALKPSWLQQVTLFLFLTYFLNDW